MLEQAGTLMGFWDDLTHPGGGMDSRKPNLDLSSEQQFKSGLTERENSFQKQA